MLLSRGWFSQAMVPDFWSTTKMVVLDTSTSTKAPSLALNTNISYFFPNGVPMSRSHQEDKGDFLEHLLGYFPGHRDWVPTLWIPRDVMVTAFAAESSMFAVACNEGRLIIGHVPPASDA